jgi:glycine betaine/proline transport system ATP-binding protein
MNNDETPAIVVEVRNVTKIFGPKPEKASQLLEEGRTKTEILEKTNHVVALQDVSFTVHEGEIFVLMGLSGCGKSTLLRCINRLIDPTSGAILIEGTDIVTMDEDELKQIRRERLGMVFQSFALLPHRSVMDNVAFGLEIRGISREERLKTAQSAVELVGLSGYEQSITQELSGGMQQRVGLARALASDPDILLMDEAFSALDPMIRRDMQDELLDIQDRLGKAIIFVTHDLDEALKLGDRIALMKDGRIIQVGTAEDILTNPENEYVERFVADVDISKVLTAADVMKHPGPTVYINDGPRVALHLMEEHGHSCLFVVGKNRKLEGVVTLDDAIEAVKKQIPIRDIMKTDIQVISTSTPVSEVITQLAGVPHHLPVVDDSGKIAGIVLPSTVISALARKEGSNGVA